MATPKKFNTRILVQLALLTAIELIFAFTVLGSLPIGPIVATLAHIPVLIAAICLGWGPGIYMGALFGVCSMVWWTVNPLPASFVFTPFVTVGEVSGGFWSVIICFVPRILLGVSATALYRALTRKMKQHYLAAGISAIAGSVIHTLLVMGGIYVFFGEQYAVAIGSSFELLLGLIGTTIMTNGLLEAVLAGIVCAALVRPLEKLTNRA
ncbi:MAG: ECF transporter S component [Clostridiaceae bacterium]|nr:ECF transporter S component [Clostridiales bacterium]MDD6876669.1 ECF transporter S component [Clostridiaceae bacterium]MDY5014461.1 ECF transporter S component [Eubacteriales bacterium]